LDDPALAEKSRDISVFLLKISDPSGEERERLGPWVIAYMAVLTAVLYALNRYTWKEVKKKLKK
jgi:ubiquinol-cytochrome c reductase cytochrome c1 subunit